MRYGDSIPPRSCCVRVDHLYIFGEVIFDHCIQLCSSLPPPPSVYGFTGLSKPPRPQITPFLPPRLPLKPGIHR
jgi:hypothetical protein